MSLDAEHHAAGKDPRARHAVVIGGASGIGAAIARAFAANGMTVTVADRNHGLAQDVAAELGHGHDAAMMNVTDEDSVSAVLERSRDSHGHLDVVVNSAGITAAGAITDLAADKFRRVVDVCLNGAFLVVKHAGRVLDDGGVIISLSSLNARQPATGMAAYGSAKAGLGMLTEIAALELAERGIRVNAIAPGLVHTPLTNPSMAVPGLEDDYLDNIPLQRPGTPEDIADAAVYVVGASWLTGVTLDLNGGAHLKRYPDLLGHLSRVGV